MHYICLLKHIPRCEEVYVKDLRHGVTFITYTITSLHGKTLPVSVLHYRTDVTYIEFKYVRVVHAGTYVTHFSA